MSHLAAERTPKTLPGPLFFGFGVPPDLLWGSFLVTFGRIRDPAFDIYIPYADQPFLETPSGTAGSVASLWPRCGLWPPVDYIYFNSHSF